MVSVDPKKTVRVQADPIEHDNSSAELANYMRSELKKKNNMENIEL